MTSVVISRAARKDLIGIRDSIRDELVNPDAATRIVRELKQSILELAELPQRGKPLDAVLSVHTEYRFLVCESYRVFYLYDGDTVEVVRILHTLQDYMRALFL